MALFDFDFDEVVPALRPRTESIGSIDTDVLSEISGTLTSSRRYRSQTEQIDEQDESAENSHECLAEKTTEYKIAITEPFVSDDAPADQDATHKPSLDDFDSLKVIGRGAYGKVLLVKHRRTEKLYAMKVLKKASLLIKAKDAEHTKAERQILEEVQHPFIVKLYYAFQTNKRLYLILEYASGGELFTHLATERMFSEEIASFYVAELVMALEHLHSLGIIYRDLKPENCLLDFDGHVVLTDFGLSKVAVQPLGQPDDDSASSSENSRANTICGTVEYMAPEILLETSYDKSVDWWSLGIMLFDMLTGSPPFVASNRKKIVDAILNKKLALPYYLSPDAKDLLIKLLRKNPAMRIGYGEIGSKAIKQHRFFRKINWEQLAKREGLPPIVPVVTNPELAENFDPKFTAAPILDSPVTPTALSSSFGRHFENFSYVASSLLDVK